MKTLLVLFALTSTAFAHRVCVEVSNVVGRQNCAQFGTWATVSRLPVLEIDTELFHETFGTQPSDVIARSTNGTTPESLDAWGVRERVLWSVFGASYMGGEIDLGGIAERADVGVALAARLVFGVRAMLPADFMISAELAGGGRVYELIDRESGVLEARGRFDWWATPHLVVGVSIGTSLIDHTDHTFTFGIGGHVHAFDGHY